MKKKEPTTNLTCERYPEKVETEKGGRESQNQRAVNLVLPRIGSPSHHFTASLLDFTVGDARRWVVLDSGWRRWVGGLHKGFMREG
jgi:hypothetical protein